MAGTKAVNHLTSRLCPSGWEASLVWRLEVSVPFLSFALFPRSVGVWAQALLKTLSQHTVSAGGSLALLQGNRD